jgi:CelD/BcsL family acetyltransferase involved in cellulose biosynthesis
MIASATRTVCAVGDLQVDVIDSLDDLLAVRQDWERVYDADPEAQFFLTWSWIYNWFSSTRQRWLVLAVRSQNAENYLAFFPLRLSTGLTIGSGFRHSIRMGGSYYAAYAGFICHPDVEVRGITALGQALQKLNWAELHLDDIFPSESRLQLLFDTFSNSDFQIGPKARPPHLSEGQVIDHDVYVIVPLGVDWETFLSTRLGSRTRFHARNELKLIGPDREFRFSISDKESIEQNLEALLQMWSSRWAPKNPGYVKYMVRNTRNMVARCFDEGSIFLPVLWKGDTRVGMTLSFADRRKGRLIGFLAARDQSIKKPSPGFVLNLFAIRWAIENGFTTCDLGTGNFAYKFHLGGEEALVKRYRIDVRSEANLHGQVDSSTLDLALEEVERAYKARELLAAERGCREILAFDPDQARVKDLPEKIARLKNAALAVLVDALKLQEGGHTEDALWLFQKVLEIDATNFEALHQIGFIHFRQRAYRLAEQFLRKAVEINGNSAAAYNNLGSALAALGRLSEALDCYGRAISLKPDYPMALKNHASTKAMIERRKQTESAVQDDAEVPAPGPSEL